MKRILLSVCSAACISLGYTHAKAQYYSRAPISNGFNFDVIANGTGTASTVTNNDVDGVNFAFVAKDYLQTATSTPLLYGLPTSGLFTSAVTATPNLSYEFASYSANNVLRLAANNDTGTLTLTTPVAAYNLYILATSGSGSSTVSAQINFSDGSSQTATGLSLADWYNNTGFALQGIGRINRTNNNLEDGGGTNPRLYQIAVNIDAANQTKLIQSVTFTKTAGTGLPNIFALSVNKYTTCPAPTAITAPTATITSTGAIVSWTAPSPAPSDGYQLYYNTTNIPPTDITPANITNITGTSTPLSGLPSNTTHYVWVRSVCGGVPGPYGFSGTFKTLCGPVTSMMENVDSYATGAIVPDCFVRLVSGSGTASISSTTPVASGNRHLYQVSSSTANSTVIVLPEFSNVNAGTNWLKFKSRSSNTTGAAIQVGYVTNIADASTFVSLYSFDVTNTTYTDLSSLRSFIIPNTVPATARLAVKNTGTKTGGFYWDDITWETAPACVEPYNPQGTAVTSATASLTWTAPSTAPSSYEIYYSTSAANAPTATSTPQVTGISGTTATVPSLSSNTTYYFWVRSNCGGSQSAWVGPALSTTSCNATTTPYTLDFENATVPSLPGCTAVINAGSGNNWYTANNPGYGFTSKVLRYDYNSSNAANSWFFTQGVQLTGGTQYTIQFDYGDNLNDSYSENLKVAYGASATVAAMTNVITDITGINTGALTHGSYTFTPATTGVYYFGFNVHSAADQFYLYVDNINIDSSFLATAETKANSKEVKVYPNPFHDILNISDVKNLETATVVDITGRAVKTFVKPSQQINLSELSAGSYLISLKYSDGQNKVIKVIKK